MVAQIIRALRFGREKDRFAAVVFFIFQEDFAAVLDAWLIGLVAWVAAWGGVMLVHYFWIEKRWPGEDARGARTLGSRAPTPQFAPATPTSSPSPRAPQPAR
mgnify:CR=1 FL=1